MATSVWFVVFLGACAQTPVNDTALSIVPWNAGFPTLADEIGFVGGFTPLRSIIHLHSPWSHDACDGAGYVDGEIDTACLADLREALCTTSIDVAYLTDHPSYAAFQPYEDLFFQQEGDTPLTVDGVTIATQLNCESGHTAMWVPGIEDELMPVGLEAHAAETGDAADTLYNARTAATIEAVRAVEGVVLMAHTEGKALEDLIALQADGLQGVEIFNLHAMLDPTKREEDLGLDGLGWATAIAPFTSPDGTGEPDLMFAGFFEEQTVSLERFDALNALAPMVGTAGTDAHQNALPLVLRDGERGDSYRRMLRWFSNTLLAESKTPTAAKEALAAGRLYVSFEAFGTPSGLDFYASTNQKERVEMGADCTTCDTGSISLTCPSLSTHSPQDGSALPTIDATVFKDGVIWQTGCGTWLLDGEGVYRGRIDITPTHLTAYLGDDPAPYLKPYPWLYTNAIRIH